MCFEAYNPDKLPIWNGNIEKYYFQLAQYYQYQRTKELTKDFKPKKGNYQNPRNTTARKKALARDNYKCRWINCRAVSTLQVHHIDRNRGNNKLSNLITYCRSHHIKAHRLHQFGFSSRIS